MSKGKASTLPSVSKEDDSAACEPGDSQPDEEPIFPAETEIYILPNGQVVIADMPAELAHLPAAIGRAASEE